MTPELNEIREALRATWWLRGPGAHVLIDGQYGSTGKGLASSVIAEALLEDDKGVRVTSNAGPNSGHTFYMPDGQKVVLRQLPSYSVYRWLRGKKSKVYLNAGAMIDYAVFRHELFKLISIAEPESLPFSTQVTVSPRACLILDSDKTAESGIAQGLGSTGKGGGSALARKVMRDRSAVVGDALGDVVHTGHMPYNETLPTLIETSQGFSLSLNASPFYPHTTSRDVTVSQALADAGIHPGFYRQTMMVVRTFPIRVGGNSGGCYPDQREIGWGDIGVPPETTTVTGKIRRVFTWSWDQFRDSLRALQPDHLFINFMNYLDIHERGPFVEEVIRDYTETLGRRPYSVILGYGPEVKDAVLAWREN